MLYNHIQHKLSVYPNMQVKWTQIPNLFKVYYSEMEKKRKLVWKNKTVWYMKTFDNYSRLTVRLDKHRPFLMVRRIRPVEKLQHSTIIPGCRQLTYWTADVYTQLVVRLLELVKCIQQLCKILLSSLCSHLLQQKLKWLMIELIEDWPFR